MATDKNLGMVMEPIDKALKSSIVIFTAFSLSGMVYEIPRKSAQFRTSFTYNVIIENIAANGITFLYKKGKCLMKTEIY